MPLPRRTPVAVLVFVVVGFVGRPAVARADGDRWDKAVTRGGVVYDRRSVPGSRFSEYRATTTVTQAAPAVIEALWAHVIDNRGPNVTHRDVVRRSDTEIVLHDLVKTPVVSDRELTLLFKKTTGSSYSILYEIRNDLWPTPDPRRVQLPVVRGGWTAIPQSDGKTRLVYTCYSEPGGSVPAWMVRGSQAEQIQTDVTLGLSLAGVR